LKGGLLVGIFLVGPTRLETAKAASHSQGKNHKSTHGTDFLKVRVIIVVVIIVMLVIVITVQMTPTITWGNFARGLDRTTTRFRRVRRRRQESPTKLADLIVKGMRTIAICSTDLTTRGLWLGVCNVCL